MLPLFIVWIGIGEESKAGFITYATFFPMFLTPVHAVRRIDPLLVRAAESLGARPRQLFFRVLLPAALPEILTGMRLGLALSFFVIVISEFIGAEHGLGYLINDGRNFFLVPQMLGAAVRSEEHTSELQSQSNLVCRLLLEKKKKKKLLQYHYII